MKLENEHCLLTFNSIIILNNLLRKLNWQIYLFNILSALYKTLKLFQKHITNPEVSCLSWVSFFLQNSLLYFFSHLFQLWFPTCAMPQMWPDGWKIPYSSLALPRTLLVGERGGFNSSSAEVFWDAAFKKVLNFSLPLSLWGICFYSLSLRMPISRSGIEVL